MAAKATCYHIAKTTSLADWHFTEDGPRLIHANAASARYWLSSWFGIKLNCTINLSCAWYAGTARG